jgi:hypothetical protein
MTRWEHKTETVKGIFRFRSSKLAEVQRICEDSGRYGWELVAVSYDWLVVQYVLYFKRPQQPPTPE